MQIYFDVKLTRRNSSAGFQRICIRWYTKDFVDRKNKNIYKT